MNIFESQKLMHMEATQLLSNIENMKAMLKEFTEDKSDSEQEKQRRIEWCRARLNTRQKKYADLMAKMFQSLVKDGDQDFVSDFDNKLATTHY